MWSELLGVGSARLVDTGISEKFREQSTHSAAHHRHQLIITTIIIIIIMLSSSARFLR
jgi:hypothetical protein